MSPKAKNAAIIFLLCTSLGAGGMLVVTRQQLAEARKAPTLKVTKTEIKTAAAPAAIVQPAATPTVEPAAENAQEARPEQQEGGPGGRNNQRGNFGAQMAELMKDPEFAAAMKLEQDARLTERYGNLFKQLNLNPEQLASLKALITEREAAGRDVMASAREQGLDPRDPAAREQLNKLAEEMRAEVDANIKSKLGDNVLSALKDYNSSTAQRSTVNDLTSRLSGTTLALNSSQTTQLTRILTETGQTTSNNGGGRGGFGGGGNNGTLITDATITQAAAVLTATQLESLKQLQAEQQAQQLIQAKMRAAREANRANNQNRN